MSRGRLETDELAARVRELQAELVGERALRTAVEATGMGTWSWLREGDHVRFDLVTAGLHGLTKGERVAGLSGLLDLIHAADRDRVRRAFERSLEAGTLDELEYRVCEPSGAVRWVMCKGRCLVDESGHPIGVTGGAFDVTERKELEAQLRQAQKMEAVGQLTTGVAHNFNNMLAVIIPNLELAAREASGAARLRLEEAIEAASRAADLVRQLMLTARNPGDREHGAIDLYDIVARTVALCRSVFGPRVRLECEPPARSISVRGDAAELEQVFLNLCVNARDALEECRVSEPSIRVDLELLQPGAGRVRVNVRDNGAGMDEALQARIFEPFFTTKDVGRGTGLGLSSAAAIIESHGGELRCSSEPGAGSTFTVELPISAESPARERPVGDGERERPGTTILVVDDEPLVRQTVVAILETCGYAVLEAEDGDGALRVFAENADRVALAMLDFSMPRRSGIEVLRELRKQRPGLPALFFSGLDAKLPDDLRDTPLMLKPVPMDELLAAVRSVLGSAGAGRER